MNGLYEPIAGLAVRIESYDLEALERPVSSAFTRLTTIVRLRGEGTEGVGEDVTYDEEDQRRLRREGTALPLAGAHTLASFSDHVAGLDLFPAPPKFAAYRQYRRWAFESAALDLALRQAGLTLATALGREPRPVRFVLSLRLPEPPTADPVLRRLQFDPGLQFKLDPTSSWTPALVEQLAATGAVESVDLKGRYSGTVVDQPPDARLYRLVAEGFPDAWIEDPALTPETERVLAPYRDRITWDEPIHSVADVEGLPYPPRAINVKPSRFGSLRELFATYEHLAARGVAPYGGGQFELGPGRGQIQYLASLFHPDAPNDVAPVAYHDPEPRVGLPTSPLAPAPAEVGFRWADGH